MKQQRGGPLQPPHHLEVATTTSDDPSIITDPRVRMLQRLGTIERALLLYGEAALLPPTPPGPPECPPGCEYCARPWAVAS